jgi:hypothetical protein
MVTETLIALTGSKVRFAGKQPSPEVRYADYVVSGLGNEDSPDGETLIKRFKKEKFPGNRGFREHARYGLRLSGSRERAWESWHAAIALIRDGGGGRSLSGHRLLMAMQEDFPLNKRVGCLLELPVFESSSV